MKLIKSIVVFSAAAAVTAAWTPNNGVPRLNTSPSYINGGLKSTSVPPVDQYNAMNNKEGISSSLTAPNPRWTGSGRWEQNSDANQQFLLQEKYGTYFKVPNPASLMTRIICTIGPASMDETVLGRMMDAGMSAARINMSHGSHETASQIIDRVRKVAALKHKLVPIILDTKGPEIRVNWLATTDNNAKALHLRSQDQAVLLTGKYSEQPPSQTLPSPLPHLQIAVSYPLLNKSVRIGDVILLDDGRISLMVTRVPNENEVHVTVIEGGKLILNKGVNLPGCSVELPHITDKDKQDIVFGVSKQVEYIAHSFTRSATGINAVRELPGVVESGTHIIAKIESQEGLDNFANILRVSDGIMVARGDLGVEIPLERVCSVQKRLVASCNAIGKPVIVATELLDSMIHHPRPTRAEASDVANAVFDGADCVMLSGETAVGNYPVEAIQVMNRICKEAELDVNSSLRAMTSAARVSTLNYNPNMNNPNQPSVNSYQTEGNALRDAFAKSAIMAASETQASLILAITRTGLTANALAKFFSSVPVMVLTTSKHVCAQVMLHRSVTPYLVDSLSRQSCVPRAIAKAIELGLVSPGSRVLLLTGKDDIIANRVETFVVGETVLPLPSGVNGDDANLSGIIQDK